MLGLSFMLIAVGCSKPAKENSDTSEKTPAKLKKKKIIKVTDIRLTKAPKKCKLIAERWSNNRVHITWASPQWSKNMVGYKLERREVDKTGKPTSDWISIAGEFNKTLLRPRLDDEFLKKNNLKKVIRDKKNRPGRVNTKAILDKIYNDPSIYNQFWFIASREIQWAVALGMGVIDTDVKDNQAMNIVFEKFLFLQVIDR